MHVPVFYMAFHTILGHRETFLTFQHKVLTPGTLDDACLDSSEAWKNCSSRNKAGCQDQRRYNYSRDLTCFFGTGQPEFNPPMTSCFIPTFLRKMQKPLL